MKRLYEFYEVNESLVLSNYDEYAKIVTDAYNELPLKDNSVVKHWDALKKSCYIWWKRMTSKVEIVFVSESQKFVDKHNGTMSIKGVEYKLIFWEGGQPYDTATQMRNAYHKDGLLYISVDYSQHPVWTVEDNVVFRSVHDYIVHIRGNNEFGLRGEYSAYNLHRKLAPDEALPALFTEIVGQVSTAIVDKDFPIQKIAAMKGFDYVELGKVDGYTVVNKKLVKNE